MMLEQLCLSVCGGTLIYALSFCLYYERIIMAEEAFLKQKFGKPYENYLRRTPAFLPNFWLWKLLRCLSHWRRSWEGNIPDFLGYSRIYIPWSCGDYFAEELSNLILSGWLYSSRFIGIYYFADAKEKGKNTACWRSITIDFFGFSR